MRTLFILFVSFFTHSLKGSELFIRVNLSGIFYATTSGQTQYNAFNTFRFFDLSSGNQNITIVDQSTNGTVLNTQIYLNQNERMVAELNENGNLIILQTIQISTPNWFTTSTLNSNFNGNGNQYNINDGFSLFILELKEEAFDGKKLIMAKKYSNKTSLASYQINEIALLFTFDNNRLDWAKHAYSSCLDKENYFLLQKAFTFSTNYRDLETYINKL